MEGRRGGVLTINGRVNMRARGWSIVTAVENCLWGRSETTVTLSLRLRVGHRSRGIKSLSWCHIRRVGIRLGEDSRSHAREDHATGAIGLNRNIDIANDGVLESPGRRVDLVGLNTGADEQEEVDQHQQDHEAKEGRLDPADVGVIRIVVGPVVIVHALPVESERDHRQDSQEPYDQVEGDMGSWVNPVALV